MKYILILLLLTSCSKHIVTGSLYDIDFKYENQNTDIIKSCIQVVEKENSKDIIEFYSYDCFKTKVNGIQLDDNFLRVYKDIKTNKDSYQLYMIIKNPKHEFIKAKSVTYTTDKIKTKELLKASTDFYCDANTCYSVEDYVLEMPEEDIKYISNSYTNGDKDYNFEYKINAKSGKIINKKIHKAEIKGMYEFVNSYKINKKVEQKIK